MPEYTDKFLATLVHLGDMAKSLQAKRAAKTPTARPTEVISDLLKSLAPDEARAAVGLLAKHLGVDVRIRPMTLPAKKSGK